MLQFGMLWSAKLAKLRSHELRYERRRGVTEERMVKQKVISPSFLGLAVSPYKVAYKDADVFLESLGPVTLPIGGSH